MTEAAALAGQRGVVLTTAADVLMIVFGPLSAGTPRQRRCAFV
jgi:hypothetical protein